MHTCFICYILFVIVLRLIICFKTSEIRITPYRYLRLWWIFIMSDTAPAPVFSPQPYTLPLCLKRENIELDMIISQWLTVTLPLVRQVSRWFTSLTVRISRWILDIISPKTSHSTWSHVMLKLCMYYKIDKYLFLFTNDTYLTT